MKYKSIADAYKEFNDSETFLKGDDLPHALQMFLATISATEVFSIATITVTSSLVMAITIY